MFNYEVYDKKMKKLIKINIEKDIQASFSNFLWIHNQRIST